MNIIHNSPGCNKRGVDIGEFFKSGTYKVFVQDF